MSQGEGESLTHVSEEKNTKVEDAGHRNDEMVREIRIFEQCDRAGETRLRSTSESWI